MGVSACRRVGVGTCKGVFCCLSGVIALALPQSSSSFVVVLVLESWIVAGQKRAIPGSFVGVALWRRRQAGSLSDFALGTRTCLLNCGILIRDRSVEMFGKGCRMNGAGVWTFVFSVFLGLPFPIVLPIDTGSILLTLRNL
jgi:hypothetical protein